MKNIVITRKRINDEAEKHLFDNGFQIHYAPPETLPEDLEALVKRVNADAIMVSQGKITKNVILASSNLSIMVKHGSGVNNINNQFAESLNIPVYRTPGANAQAVAELTITLAILLRKQIPYLNYKTKNNQWVKSEFIGMDLIGSTIGLIGFGDIAKKVATLAISLGMTVFVFDPFYQGDVINDIRLIKELDELIQHVDIISLHCPLTQETKDLISTKQLQKMKPTSVIINTARGGIINEKALAWALNHDEIAGAALDSFSTEPPPKNHPLWKAKNFIATPHIAGVTQGAERNMALGAANIIIDFFAQKEINSKFKVSSQIHGGINF